MMGNFYGKKKTILDDISKNVFHYFHGCKKTTYLVSCSSNE